MKTGHASVWRACLSAGARSARIAVLPVSAGSPFLPFLSFLPFQVNENFAIDLIAEQPVSEVGSRVISCDGGGGALGHPRVYINLDKETKTGTCGYCGLQFRQPHH